MYIAGKRALPEFGMQRPPVISFGVDQDPVLVKRTRRWYGKDNPITELKPGVNEPPGQNSSDDKVKQFYKFKYLFSK